MKTIHAHGLEMPALGFGTYRLRGAEAEEGVRDALDVGYRHIDTAQMYRNEGDIGRALAASPVDRDDVFLTTKVWPDHYAPDDLLDSVAASLRKLQTDHVDLLLLHWPKFDVPMAETLAALNDVHEAGQAKHIGVSNFTTALMAEAQDLSTAPLAANQVEYHPFLRQTPVLEAVREADMTLTAYSPLAQGAVFENDTLDRIGARYRKSPGQVSLRWLIQQDAVSAIPKASSPEHRRENFAVFDFNLTDEEMAAIHDLARPDGRTVNPRSLAPEWDDPGA